jgi:hypothetical protein
MQQIAAARDFMGFSKKQVAGKMTVPNHQLLPARREPLHGL